MSIRDDIKGDVAKLVEEFPGMGRLAGVIENVMGASHEVHLAARIKHDIQGMGAYISAEGALAKAKRFIDASDEELQASRDRSDEMMAKMSGCTLDEFRSGSMFAQKGEGDE
jgi:hypothetical protein